MYAIKDNTVVKIDAKNIIRLGVIDDARVERMEQIISKAYRIGVQDISVFYNDSDAKIMLCFLLHDMFNYSISSIAERYNIYASFLDKNIREHYHNCLLSKEFYNKVALLKDSFFNEIKTSNTAQN